MGVIQEIRDERRSIDERIWVTAPVRRRRVEYVKLTESKGSPRVPVEDAGTWMRRNEFTVVR